MFLLIPKNTGKVRLQNLGHSNLKSLIKEIPEPHLINVAYSRLKRHIDRVEDHDIAKINETLKALTQREKEYPNIVTLLNAHHEFIETCFEELLKLNEESDEICGALNHNAMEQKKWRKRFLFTTIIQFVGLLTCFGILFKFLWWFFTL